jgi:hypothetical protein
VSIRHDPHHNHHGKFSDSGVACLTSETAASFPTRLDHDVGILVIVKWLKSTPLGRFSILCIAAVVYYLMYSLICSLLGLTDRPDLSWYETGMFHAGPYGFGVAVTFVVVGLVQLLRGRL